MSNFEPCAERAELSGTGYCQGSFTTAFKFVCPGKLCILLLCKGLALYWDTAVRDDDGPNWELPRLLCCSGKADELELGLMSKLKADMDGGRFELAMAGSKVVDLPDPEMIGCALAASAFKSVAALVRSVGGCTAVKSSGLTLILMSFL